MIEIQDIKAAAEAGLAELALTRISDESGGGSCERGSAGENDGEGGERGGAGDSEGAGGSEGDGSGADGGLFLVDLAMSPGNEIEIFIDSDSRGVTVEDCIALSRTIEAKFDRDVEDFSLTVSSAGIGQPLRVARQYRKLVGKSIEVVLNTGVKLLAVLESFEADKNGDTAGGSITLSYPEKRKAEGKKRPETVTVKGTFPLAEVKSAKEHIDFK